MLFLRRFTSAKYRDPCEGLWSFRARRGLSLSHQSACTQPKFVLFKESLNLIVTDTAEGRSHWMDECYQVLDSGQTGTEYSSLPSLDLRFLV